MYPGLSITHYIAQGFFLMSPKDSDYNNAEGTQSGSDDDIVESPAKSDQMTQQVDDDSMSPPPPPSPSPPPPPPTRVDKGKRRALCVPADEEEIDNDGHVVDDEQDLDASKVPGRLPREATRRALALSEKTEQEAKKIAKEYGKDVQMILIAAGLAHIRKIDVSSLCLYIPFYI